MIGYPCWHRGYSTDGATRTEWSHCLAFDSHSGSVPETTGTKSSVAGLSTRTRVRSQEAHKHSKCWLLSRIVFPEWLEIIGFDHEIILALLETNALLLFSDPDFPIGYFF